MAYERPAGPLSGLPGLRCERAAFPRQLSSESAPADHAPVINCASTAAKIVAAARVDLACSPPCRSSIASTPAQPDGVSSGTASAAREWSVRSMAARFARSERGSRGIICITPDRRELREHLIRIPVGERRFQFRGGLVPHPQDEAGRVHDGGRISQPCLQVIGGDDAAKLVHKSATAAKSTSCERRRLRGGHDEVRGLGTKKRGSLRRPPSKPPERPERRTHHGTKSTIGARRTRGAGADDFDGLGMGLEKLADDDIGVETDRLRVRANEGATNKSRRPVPDIVPLQRFEQRPLEFGLPGDRDQRNALFFTAPAHSIAKTSDHTHPCEHLDARRQPRMGANNTDEPARRVTTCVDDFKQRSRLDNSACACREDIHGIRLPDELPIPEHEHANAFFNRWPDGPRQYVTRAAVRSRDRLETRERLESLWPHRSPREWQDKPRQWQVGRMGSCRRGRWTAVESIP